jgi:hypothetical protein
MKPRQTINSVNKIEIAAPIALKRGTNRKNKIILDSIPIKVTFNN